jgi:tRNA (mo5U34)-methyltransferase
MEYKILSAQELKEMAAIDWWHTIPIGWDEKKNLLFTPGRKAAYDSKIRGIPDDLSGKRVLDIGAWDGYFTWACEKAGADVTSIEKDPRNSKGFEFCRKVLNAKAKLVHLDICDLPREMYQQFDFVLNFGVLYHLHNPMQALKRTFQATRPGGIAVIETAYDAGNSELGLSLWSLWPNLDGDSGNFFFPTIAGLENALKVHGFVDFQHTITERSVNVDGKGWANWKGLKSRLVMTGRRPK